MRLRSGMVALAALGLMVSACGGQQHGVVGPTTVEGGAPVVAPAPQAQPAGAGSATTNQGTRAETGTPQGQAPPGRPGVPPPDQTSTQPVSTNATQAPAAGGAQPASVVQSDSGMPPAHCPPTPKPCK